MSRSPSSAVQKSGNTKMHNTMVYIRQHWQLYLLFIMPAFLLTIIFRYIPMGGIAIAFTEYNPIKGILASDFVGFQHFTRFLSSPDFMSYLVNTLKLSVFGLLWGFPAPILLAFLLNRILSKKRKQKSSVLAIIRQNIEYSYWVEIYYDSDDEDEEYPLYRIYIDLWDIGPQALMKKLGFDAFHLKWADFLYDNLTESQAIDPTSPDYTGDQPGVSIGDVSFADGGREVVYWNQMDQRWCNEPYGKTQTIGYVGCGPTALAIVVSTLTGNTMNPKEMADWAYENGYCCEGDGSYRTLIPEGAAHFGLSVSSPGRSGVQEVVDALAQGKLVVAIMGPGHFTTSGHFIVLRGVTAEGKLLVADPVSLTKSQQEWDAEIVFSETSILDAAGGPFWIIG